MNLQPQVEVLKPHEAAAILGVTLDRMARWRASGAGPPYLVWGRRTIRYRVTDLDAWLESQRSVRNTAEAEQVLSRRSVP